MRFIFEPEAISCCFLIFDAVIGHRLSQKGNLIFEWLAHSSATQQTRRYLRPRATAGMAGTSVHAVVVRDYPNYK